MNSARADDELITSEMRQTTGGDMGQQQLMTQSELFKSYAESNQLFLNISNSMHWFEFGGNKIGRLYIEGPEAEEFPKWRLTSKYKGEFSCHFALVFINGGAVGSPNIETHADVGSWFLLGGMGNNCNQYINKNIINKAPMPQEKSFFSACSAHGGHMIYTFGGYESNEKNQLTQCEYYKVQEDKWYMNEEVQLNQARSQSSCCLFEENIIFIFGGYNKQLGTLSSIERYDIDHKKIQLLQINMTIPLRRFGSCKISASKILLLGGITRLSKDSDAVFCFDIDPIESDKPKDKNKIPEHAYSLENLDKTDKAGVIEWPVIIDSVGSLHLFVENASGTSPP
jgi:hypothetical protein